MSLALAHAHVDHVALPGHVARVDAHHDLVVPSTSDVPVEFLKLREPELDKTAVKKAIKAGEEIPGCALVTRQNLTIK